MAGELFRRIRVARATVPGGGPTDRVLADAADEIERLRTERDEGVALVKEGLDHIRRLMAERDAVEVIERLTAERDRLREELDAAQLRSIEARNPGIDTDEVKRLRSAAIGESPVPDEPSVDEQTERWLERAKAGAQPGPKHAAPVDLMDALEASIAAAKADRRASHPTEGEHPAP